MSYPQRDADGNVVPHDDPSIDNSSGVIRHINPKYHLLNDENTGTRRITSAAFTATKGEPEYPMSVDIEQDLLAAGLPSQAMVPTGFGAVRLHVGEVRALDLKVGAEPVPGNDFHGEVWGVKETKRKKLHRIVEGWIVPLPGVDLR